MGTEGTYPIENNSIVLPYPLCDIFVRLNIYNAPYMTWNETERGEREIARWSRSWRGTSLNVTLSRDVHGVKAACV